MTSSDPDVIRRQIEETRREHPDSAREFINSYMKERLKAARRVFNDPDEIEKIVELLEAAERGRGSHG